MLLNRKWSVAAVLCTIAATCGQPATGGTEEPGGIEIEGVLLPEGGDYDVPDPAPAWPAGAPSQPPAGSVFYVYENWTSPSDTDIQTTELNLVFSQDEWNLTEDEQEWVVTVAFSTTHSYSISATVGVEVTTSAGAKTGGLSKLIAEAHVDVSVTGNFETTGEYSSSETKSRSSTITTAIQQCRGKARREYITSYTGTVTSAYADRVHVAVLTHDHDTFGSHTHTYELYEGLVVYEGTASGDDHQVGVFSDLGAYSQTDPTKHCCGETAVGGPGS